MASAFLALRAKRPEDAEFRTAFDRQFNEYLRPLLGSETGGVLLGEGFEDSAVAEAIAAHACWAEGQARRRLAAWRDKEEFGPDEVLEARGEAIIGSLNPFYDDQTRGFFSAVAAGLAEPARAVIEGGISRRSVAQRVEGVLLSAGFPQTGFGTESAAPVLDGWGSAPEPRGPEVGMLRAAKAIHEALPFPGQAQFARSEDRLMVAVLDVSGRRRASAAVGRLEFLGKIEVFLDEGLEASLEAIESRLDQEGFAIEPAGPEGFYRVYSLEEFHAERNAKNWELIFADTIIVAAFEELERQEPGRYSIEGTMTDIHIYDGDTVYMTATGSDSGSRMVFAGPENPGVIEALVSRGMRLKRMGPKAFQVSIKGRRI